jgi:hypothetical protein
MANLRTPVGFRMVVETLSERLQEELANRGFVVGCAGQECWIESRDREMLTPLIDCVRAAGITIASVEKVWPTLARYREASGVETD